MKKLLLAIMIIMVVHANAQRSILDFNNNWKFFLGNDSTAIQISFNDSKWRTLNLPHDWSIELPFDEKAPATNQGAALPGGIGWYRKTFTLPSSSQNKKVFIAFDGVYRNSEVWVNGHYLGKRPNGYISFQYELTAYLKFGNEKNIIAVKVDNSQQPNSRWYSGSGIYRDVKLIATDKTAIDYNGTFITTSKITNSSAEINIQSIINIPFDNNKKLIAKTNIYNASGKIVASKITSLPSMQDTPFSCNQKISINNPVLWSIEKPYLYKAVITIYQNNILIDNYTTTFGIRYFNFDVDKGFSLNGIPTKIKGVCMHHDLGALGAAFNRSAAERQLRILKEMGCNAIRTSHNPPASEFLDLCDSMGFLVMDEAFDMWKKKKNKYDYFSDFNEWHQRDLEEMIKRDRNHPSVFMWSIGNEIREQFDSTGITITKELVKIIKALDTTRPVTSALSEWNPDKNFIYKSDALDVIGLNYHQEVYKDFKKYYPNKKFIAAETMSALATRGHYDKVSDTTVLWPQHSPLKYVEGGNKDLTVSAYDNVVAYWGTTHEATWKIVKKYDFLSGLFVWSGFDFLGEPIPYPYPARSSYYGIVDLAGFPKDVYYMYQSEWTDKPVLHIFPHWNWNKNDTVDVWCYYNNADEVELFVNNKSLGIRKKQNDDLHVAWKVKFEEGTLKAVSRKNRKIILEREVKTTGKPYKIELTAEKKILRADGKEICFVTVKILDKDGNLVPDADNLIQFSVEGKASIAGIDNGFQASLESFKSNDHKVYNGMAVVMLQSSQQKSKIVLKANSPSLQTASITIMAQ